MLVTRETGACVGGERAADVVMQRQDLRENVLERYCECLQESSCIAAQAIAAAKALPAIDTEAGSMSYQDTVTLPNMFVSTSAPPLTLPLSVSHSLPAFRDARLPQGQDRDCAKSSSPREKAAGEGPSRGDIQIFYRARPTAGGMPFSTPAPANNGAGAIRMHEICCRSSLVDHAPPLRENVVERV